MDWTAGRFGAIEDEAGNALSGVALRAAVGERAETFRQAGATDGCVIEIARPEALGTLIDLLAAWRTGAAGAVLDSDLSPPERDRVSDACRPVLRTGAGGVLSAGKSPARILPERGRDRAALILYTSGTTGTPKGVVLTHRALEARVVLNRQAIGDAPLSRVLQTLPLHFGHGLIGVALTTLAAGGTLLLAPRGLPLSSRLGEIVDEREAAFFSSVPTLWRAALRLATPPRKGTLARVHVGSAPLAEPLWRDIAGWAGAQVWNCYGITEAANWICGAPHAEGVADGTVGRTWGGSLAVRRSDGTLCPEGEGEIHLRSPALFSGYLDGAPAGDWYATGDSGRLSADGTLVLTGRLKEEINVGGTKVRPADVDAVLERHPGVAEACTFCGTDPVTGETVCAAVVPAPDFDADGLERDLRTWCAARLRSVARPRRLHVVDAIPRTPRGKVSRTAVARALEGG